MDKELTSYKMHKQVMKSSIEVIHGDAIEELKNIPSQEIDLIVSDPPYNLGKDFGKSNAIKNFEEYIRFTKEWTNECRRVLKEDGTIYSFMGFKFISYLYQILEKNMEMHFNNWITWNYTQGMGRRKGFSSRHEDILMFTKSENFNFYLDNVRIPQKYYRKANNMRGANPGDVWEFSHVHYCQNDREKHPTQKPEGLIERLVLASSKEGDKVLDPFAGSGTTLRVCQHTNRDCVGIEKNEEYVEMTEKRLSREAESLSGIDPRMKRIPNDLNDKRTRVEYLSKHIEWFLGNHQEEIDEFFDRVTKKYGPETTNEVKKKVGVGGQVELEI